MANSKTDAPSQTIGFISPTRAWTCPKNPFSIFIENGFASVQFERERLSWRLEVTIKILTKKKFMEIVSAFIEDLRHEDREMFQIQREIIQMNALIMSVVSLACSLYFRLQIAADWTVYWANILFFGMGASFWFRKTRIRPVVLDIISIVSSYGGILWVISFLGVQSGVNLSSMATFSNSLMMFFPKQRNLVLLSLATALFCFFSPLLPGIDGLYTSYRPSVRALGGVRTLVEATVFLVVVINTFLFAVFWTSRMAHWKSEKAKKEQYLKILTHDLKAPVIHSLTALRSIKYRAPGVDRDLQAIETAQISVKEMLNNVENIESESVTLGHMNESLSLGACLAKILPWLETRLLEKEIHLCTNGVSEKHRLDGHFESVTYQVLLNILTNAIKFSPVQGHIRLSTTVNDGVTSWIVTDSGVGIDNEELTTVIKPRLGTIGERGSGLGVKIIRQFAEKNHIDVSWKKAEGTTVTLSQGPRF